MTDININVLNKKTIDGIRKALSRLGYDDLVDKTWFELDQMAYLYFMLRAFDDDPEIFPSGKWATIQRIGELCDVEAKEQVALNLVDA